MGIAFNDEPDRSAFYEAASKIDTFYKRQAAEPTYTLLFGNLTSYYEAALE